MMFLTIVLAGVAVVLLAPTLSDLLSLARVAIGAVAPAPPRSPGAQRLLFLVPAHNEELLLAGCVRSLHTQAYTHDQRRVVVIADNCTDRTAAVARVENKECLERRDPEHPGKPHAIAWALTQLPVQAYDAVVIVDADTIVDPSFAAEISAVGPLRSIAVQAYFGLSNPTESPITRMSAVLAAAIHRFAYPLKQRAGLNVPLVGNGMAVGTEVLATHGWHAFSICEDWEMFALLTANHVKIAGAPRARMYAQETHSLDERNTQHQR
jgi:cellulose synthase/poly-beta-1,6-N-acetylglucosamine synthase-like glycosyltransferase